MQNPFETGHIRNYILFYASVVLIMILFFFVSSLFNDVKVVDKKVFNTKVKERSIEVKNPIKKKNPTKFKLLDKAY